MGILMMSCQVLKQDRIIDNGDQTISVIHYNKFSNDSTIQRYLAPITHKLEVIGKAKPNGVYVRWGRSNDPIDIKKDWKNIKPGDEIIIIENFYPKYKISYYGRANKDIK